MSCETDGQTYRKRAIITNNYYYSFEQLVKIQRF